MESQRQKKVARLIQKELSEVFVNDTKSKFSGALITITEVSISPDLGLAKVYLSFLPDNRAEELLGKIKELTKFIRNLLAERVRKQLRIIPQLIFILDTAPRHAEKIEKILSGIHIPPAPPEEEE